MDRTAFHILVDDRESAVIPHMHEHAENNNCAPFFVERLTVGDYAIMFRDVILMIIERKTWADMASSIKDGRSKNVQKMINVRAETGCSVVYLIEGRAFPNPKSRVGRIPYKSLQARLDRLMIRDGIATVRARNAEGTAARLFELAVNLESLNLDAVQRSLAADNDDQGSAEAGATGGRAMLKAKVVKSESSKVYDMWRAIPWITDKTATILIDEGITVGGFLRGGVSKETLAGMRYPSGSVVGVARATKMLKSAKPNAKSHMAIIRAVPSVGKTTAVAFLNTMKLHEWLGLDDAEPQLKEIKINGRYLSKTVVSNIQKYLLT